MGIWGYAMEETITYAARSSFNDDGDPTYGTQSTLKGRIETDDRVFTMPSGREEDKRTIVYTETAVTEDMVFWLPSDNTSEPGREPSEVNKSTKLGGGSPLYKIVL